MQRLSRNETKDGAALRGALKDELLARCCTPYPLRLEGTAPFTILVVGFNAVGKTTTIGKLAAKYAAEGRKVLLAAGYLPCRCSRALEIWAIGQGCPLSAHQEGADPSAVAFDACKAAVSRGTEILIIDTAGRLHTKVNLMEEMKKIHRCYRT